MAEPDRSWAALDRAALFAGLCAWILSISDKITHRFGYRIDNLDIIGAATGLAFFGVALTRSVLAPASRERLWEADRSVLRAYCRLVVGLAMLVVLAVLGGYYLVKRWPF